MGRDPIAQNGGYVEFPPNLFGFFLLCCIWLWAFLNPPPPYHPDHVDIPEEVCKRYGCTPKGVVIPELQKKPEEPLARKPRKKVVEDKDNDEDEEKAKPTEEAKTEADEQTETTVQRETSAFTAFAEGKDFTEKDKMPKDLVKSLNKVVRSKGGFFTANDWINMKLETDARVCLFTLFWPFNFNLRHLNVKHAIFIHKNCSSDEKYVLITKYRWRMCETLEFCLTTMSNTSLPTSSSSHYSILVGLGYNFSRGVRVSCCRQNRFISLMSHYAF